MTKKIAIAILALCALCGGQGSADSATRGNLACVILDASGTPIVGAKATVSGPSGVKSEPYRTGSDLIFPLLMPGSYSLKAEKAGFKTVTAESIPVFSHKTVSIRVPMQAGDPSEIVMLKLAPVFLDEFSVPASPFGDPIGDTADIVLLQPGDSHKVIDQPAAPPCHFCRSWITGAVL